jgi:hypothetical protein
MLIMTMAAFIVACHVVMAMTWTCAMFFHGERMLEDRLACSNASSKATVT